MRFLIKNAFTLDILCGSHIWTSSNIWKLSNFVNSKPQSSIFGLPSKIWNFLINLLKFVFKYMAQCQEILPNARFELREHWICKTYATELFICLNTSSTVLYRDVVLTFVYRPYQLIESKNMMHICVVN